VVLLILGGILSGVFTATGVGGGGGLVRAVPERGRLPTLKREQFLKAAAKAVEDHRVGCC